MKSIIHLRTLALGVLLCGIASFSPASANDYEKPEKALQTTIEALIDALHADDQVLSYQSKREQIIAILNKDFSFDIIIQRALGRNWKKLDARQQDQVTGLITDLVLQAYVKELKDGSRPRIRYEAAKPLSSSKIEIASKVEVKGTKVNLSYRLANLRDRGWQVYDVLVEGVSMVANYRKQFDEHFQKKSASDLIVLLKDKLQGSE